MTDDEFEQLILFKLMDFDTDGFKYAAVDYDGEIVVGFIPLIPRQEQSAIHEEKLLVTLWGDVSHRYSKLSCVYITSDKYTTPDNHRTVMITL